MTSRPPARCRPRRAAHVAALMVLAFAATAPGQPVDERLDEAQYLDGLVTLRLPEVLEHYISTHPTEDPVRAARYEIARQRMAIADPAAAIDARLDAVARLGEIRRALVDAHPGDERRAGWLTDQAATIWSEVLPIEACGLSSLLGEPTESQRRRASAAAAEMNALTALAEIEIDDALRVIESSPGFADDVALRRRRARLADLERDRRIPFFRGVAALLHAELNARDAADRRELREIAAELLVPLGDRLDGAPAADALLYGGIALAKLGRVERADDVLARCLEHPAADALDGFCAAYARIIAAAPGLDLPAALARVDALERVRPRVADDLERLLLADRRAILHRQEAERLAPGDRRAALAAAVQCYLDLIDDGDVTPGGWLESSVRERLRLAVGPDLPLDELPPLVTIARAAELAAHDGTRDEAIGLYEHVLGRDDVTDRDRAAARFGLARTRLLRGDAATAAGSFIDLARDHPAQPVSEQAVEIGVALARDLARRDPADASAAARLRDGLDLLLARYPNLRDIDGWRFLAGRLALDDGRLDEAQAHFGQVSPGAPAWPDAILMQVVVQQTRRDQTTDLAARAPIEDLLLEQAASARERLQAAAARSADPALAEQCRRNLLRVRLLEADARREQGDAEIALRLLDDLERDAALDVDLRGQVLRIRFLAYRRLARPGEAMLEARRLVQQAPAAASDILGALLGALRRDAEDLLAENRDEEAAALVSEMLLPLAEVLEVHLADRAVGPAEAPEAWLDIAAALRHGERFSRALAVYEALLALRPGDLRLLLGRAECLFGLGEARLADAMLVYRRIAAAGAGAGEPYWLAQLRMLQILDRTGRNTHKIVPRILRLRREDPDLGGERLRRGFERLQGKYA